MAPGFGFRYGLYPFIAENEDEISFQPGEKIEILEQDDQYGDGWWQVRFPLLSPRVGLRGVRVWACRGRVGRLGRCEVVSDCRDTREVLDD